MKKSQAFFGNIFKKTNFSVDHISWNQVIRDIRKGFNESQTVFGKRFGVSPSQIARFEKGQVEPPIAFWKQLSEMYDLNLDWVFTGNGPAQKNTHNDSLIVNSLSTSDLKKEIGEREKIVSVIRSNIQKLRNDILKNGPQTNETFDRLTQRVNDAAKKAIPLNSPKWLLKDLEDIL